MPAMKCSAREGSDTWAHTSAAGAPISICSATLTRAPPPSPAPPSSEHRQAALGGERLEGVLHEADDVLVDLVHVGLWPELLLHVDRRQRLDRDLRRQRHVPEQVADVDAPGDRERDRQHLEAQELVELERPRQALPARQEDRGLLSA